MAVTRRRLVVDPIACDGHGICAELLPEVIRRDDWGYPIIDPEPVAFGLEGLAKRAVAACPKLALALRDAPVTHGRGGSSSPRPPARPAARTATAGRAGKARRLS